MIRERFFDETPRRDVYEPPGIRFHDGATRRDMVLVTDGPSKGWLCYRHPDGQWVTLRVATVGDLATIHAACTDAGIMELLTAQLAATAPDASPPPAASPPVRRRAGRRSRG
jgi:hypothetical protein